MANDADCQCGLIYSSPPSQGHHGLRVDMSTYITHVRLSPPNSNDHQHITHVRWQQTSKSGESTKAAMVAFIQEGNTVWVAGPPDAQVGVVNGNPPYLRTHADGQWTNNLLSLPRF
jgi:hypothetical protein